MNNTQKKQEGDAPVNITLRSVGESINFDAIQARPIHFHFCVYRVWQLGKGLGRPKAQSHLRILSNRSARQRLE